MTEREISGRDESGLSAFRECLRKSYGDLENPTRDFVSPIELSRPFSGLVKHLQRQFRVTDHTETNYEVCFAYGISRSSQVPTLALWLSMAGPYAVLLRQSIAGQSPVEVVSRNGLKDVDEILIWHIVEGHGFRFLDLEELEMPMDIRLWNRRYPPPLYAAFFLNEGIGPWQAKLGEPFEPFSED